MNDVRHSLGTHLGNDPGVNALVGQRVYFQLGPDGAQLPYVVYQQQTESDQWTMGRNLFQRTEWLVKGLARDLSDAEDIEEACKAALDGVNFPMQVKTLISCRRIGGLRYSERDGGYTVWHICGRYAIEVMS